MIIVTKIMILVVNITYSLEGELQVSITTHYNYVQFELLFS